MSPKGWPAPARKLTAKDAQAMRIAFAAGKSIKDLEEEYGVSNSTVWNVVNYETWVSAGPPRRWKDEPKKGS